SNTVQAVFLVLEHQKRFCGWASSYDMGAISAYSPGDLLLQHVISVACIEGIEIFDLGAGDDSYKTRWLHDEEPMSAAIFGYGWRGLAATQMLILGY
ncbi:MAG: GNAT family N-acetyltransferase, partial [Pseudomonadota bacterium]